MSPGKMIRVTETEHHVRVTYGYLTFDTFMTPRPTATIEYEFMMLQGFMSKMRVWNLRRLHAAIIYTTELS